MATRFPDGDFFGSRFDGKRFYNIPNGAQPGRGAVLRWLLNRKPGAWDPPGTFYTHGQPPPERVGSGEARVTFINHATVLVQMDGLNLLTDPIYADRASPFKWAGPRRVRPPGIALENLPRIDALLISHNHFDHMCLETIERLALRDKPAVFTGLGNASVLEKKRVERVAELDWWQSAEIGDSVRITYVPARHFSSRSPFDRDRALWGGFYILGSRHRLYFAADSGWGPHFGEIGRRLGAPDLAMLPIGAYRPAEVMLPVHISPEEAVAAHREVGAFQSLAIHFGTFPMADDGQYEPAERLHRALQEAGLTDEDFHVPEFGEGMDVAAQFSAAGAPPHPPQSS